MKLTQKFAAGAVSLALVLFCADAFAQSQYDALRQDLKGKQPTPGYIASTRLDTDTNPLTLREQETEIKNECRSNPSAPKCADYKRLFDTRELRDFCELNPLDRKCRQLNDSKFNRMMKRQSRCRAGLEDRECRIAHLASRREDMLHHSQ